MPRVSDRNRRDQPVRHCGSLRCLATPSSPPPCSTGCCTTPSSCKSKAPATACDSTPISCQSTSAPKPSSILLRSPRCQSAAAGRPAMPAPSPRSPEQRYVTQVRVPIDREPDAAPALTSAERQARYRARRQALQANHVVRYRRPADRRSRPQRWHDATHCPTASATHPRQRHSTRSSNSTLPLWPPFSRRAATVATDPYQTGEFPTPTFDRNPMIVDSGSASALTPRSRWTALLTRSSPPWPARR